MSDLWKDQKPEKPSPYHPVVSLSGVTYDWCFFANFVDTFSWQAIDQSEERLGGPGSNFQETGEWFVAQRGDVEVKSTSIMAPPQFFWGVKLPRVRNSQWILFDDWACVFCESLYCKSLQWILESCKSCKLIQNYIHQVSYGPNNYVHLKFGCMHHEEVLAES